MYATWVSLATLLNMGIAVVYSEPHLEQDTASYIILGLYTSNLSWFISIQLRMYECNAHFLFLSA